MKNLKLSLLFVLFSAYVSQDATRIGILINKASVLSFNDDIIDVELGNQDYYLKIKGKCLLIRAKTKKAQSTTLFVRYGKNKQFYVAEIFPDDTAPLQQYILVTPEQSSSGATRLDLQEYDLKHKKLSSVFTPDEPQEYFNYGVNKGGVKIILTNLAHKGDTTYLRFFIENNTAVNLKLFDYTFEYVTFFKKFLFFRTKKKKLVEPIIVPPNLELSSNTSNYFEFAIPTYISNGGVEIYFGERAQGEREFQLTIPSSVLIKAKRK